MRTASRRWPGQLPRAEARRLVRTAVSQAPSLGRHCPKKCIWRGARDENISDSPCEPCRRTSSSLLPFSFKAGPDKSLPEHRSLPSPGISPHEAFKNFTRPHTILGTIVRSSFSFRHVPENQTSFCHPNLTAVDFTSSQVSTSSVTLMAWQFGHVLEMFSMMIAAKQAAQAVVAAVLMNVAVLDQPGLR